MAAIRTITISKIDPPLVLNGQIAELQQTVDITEVDDQSGDVVLVSRHIQNLFGETATRLRSSLTVEKDKVEQKRTDAITEADEVVAGIDKAIADIDVLDPTAGGR